MRCTVPTRLALMRCTFSSSNACSCCSRASLTSCGVSSARLAAGVPGRGLKTKLKLASKPMSSISCSVLRVVVLGLAGKADDEVARQADVGPHRAQLAHGALVFEHGVAALHCHQDAVAAVLHRQVQVVHELGTCARRHRPARGVNSLGWLVV
jgi:hypothetical protein